MDKWADYGISAIRYSQDKIHIDKLKIHEDNIETIGQAVAKSRKYVLSGIKKAKTFITIFGKGDGFEKGDKVQIVTVDGEEFIRTDNKQQKGDYLENLPEY